MEPHDKYQNVTFYFQTNAGPAKVTVQVLPSLDIDDVGDQLLETFESMYETVELTSYEIIKLC